MPLLRTFWAAFLAVALSFDELQSCDQTVPIVSMLQTDHRFNSPKALQHHSSAVEGPATQDSVHDRAQVPIAFAARMFSQVSSANASADPEPGTSLRRLTNAVLAKFVGSIDDIVWLVPFVIHNDVPVQVALTYLLAMQLVASISILIYEASISIAHSVGGGGDRMQRMISLCCVFLLFLLTVKAYFDSCNDKPEPEAPEGQHTSAAAASGETPEGKQTEKIQQSEEMGAWSLQYLMSVALICSAGDVAVFLPLLENNASDPIMLCIGTLLASCLTFALCMVASQISFLHAYISMVPLWVVCALMTVLSLILSLTG